MFGVIITPKTGYTPEDIVRFLNNHRAHEPAIRADGTVYAHVNEIIFESIKPIAHIRRI